MFQTAFLQDTCSKGASIAKLSVLCKHRPRKMFQKIRNTNLCVAYYVDILLVLEGITCIAGTVYNYYYYSLEKPKNSSNWIEICTPMVFLIGLYINFWLCHEIFRNGERPTSLICLSILLRFIGIGGKLFLYENGI